MDANNWLFYYRVSTTRQGVDGHALERYAASADRYGIPESNRYEDTESGASYTRKGFRALCDRIEHDNKITRLVVPAQSRLHRDLFIWAQLRDLLLRKNVELIDLYKGGQPVDLLSIATTVEAALAEEQRHINKKHSREGHAFRRSQGKAHALPFGYTLDKGGFCVPDHSEYRPGVTYWQAARVIVETYIELNSFEGTARHLLDLWGEAGHKDHPSTGVGVRYWLESPVIRGHLVYFGHKRSVGEKQVLADNHEALLTTEQAQIIDPRLRYKRAPTVRTPHQLYGLLECGECGGVMSRTKITNPAGTAYYYLKCRRAYPRGGKPRKCTHRVSYPYSDIEDQVIRALTTRASELSAEVLCPNEETENPRIAELKNEIQQLLKISGAEMLIEKKQRQIAALRGEDDDQVNGAMDEARREMLQETLAIPDFWETLEPAEKAEAYRGILEAVTIALDGSVDCRFLL